MTVYIDVLIAVNIIVDYFLLLLAGRFLNLKPKSSRVIISAIVGGLFSIYIFFPHISAFVDAIYKLLTCILMSFIAFGYKNIKTFTRCTCVLFAVSFIYGGVMLALVNIVPLKVLLVYNSVVYYDISPITLIIFTGIFYITAILLKSILKKNNPLAKTCVIEISFNGLESKFDAIFDTGNSAKDIISGSDVLIVDKKSVGALIKGEPRDFPKAYRLIPVSTVSGTKLLEAVRCEKAKLYLNDKKLILNKPILAISETSLDKEYSVLLNPELLTKTEA